jgi:hypothetical protein
MRTLLALSVSLAGLLLDRQPPAAAPTEQPDAAEQRVANAWGARLVKLDPADPMTYFLLGEDVAETARDAPARDLARRLFVLAYELDARRTAAPAPGATFALGPSVCMALASLATRDDERRWLRALAETLAEGPSGTSEAPPRAAESWPQETAFELATAMGLARSGEGRRAAILLEKPGVAELLAEVNARPMPDGRPASLKNFLERTIRDWPACPQCRNRRVVPAGANRSGEMVLCDTCRGNPGPRMLEDELANQLRLESVLLQGVQRSWAAQVLADAGAPLRDLDPTELAGTYGVDPARPLWRDGAWTAIESGSTPAAATPGESGPR